MRLNQEGHADLWNVSWSYFGQHLPARLSKSLWTQVPQHCLTSCRLNWNFILEYSNSHDSWLSRFWFVIVSFSLLSSSPLNMAEHRWTPNSTRDSRKLTSVWALTSCSSILLHAGVRRQSAALLWNTFCSSYFGGANSKMPWKAALWTIQMWI